jgi:maltose phosphorylase
LYGFDEAGVINYEITPLNQDAKITYKPYIDAGVHNEDANWEEKFWEPLDVKHAANAAFVTARTFKTHFTATTFMQNDILKNGSPLNLNPENVSTDKEKVQFEYTVDVAKGDVASIHKIGGYTVSMNHENTYAAAQNVIASALQKGYEQLFEDQIKAWAKIWDMSDITIDGDVKAQQGIRFNIFQLNQTYSGKDSRFNIGPKGFTGEKYGGSTYWDTEAYCIPFYMATKDQQVARNLLTYRYNQLDKAIENAQKLGFKNGAALYPMVTMNGEECHNEWEITFEEIHRNGAIAFAIFNYNRFTGDYSYIPEKGLEVLIGIARFWQQRANFSADKNKYVILGVTGPNEYENNVNNNFYTNYIAKWCIDYTLEQIAKVASEYASDYNRIAQKPTLPILNCKAGRKSQTKCISRFRNNIMSICNKTVSSTKNSSASPTLTKRSAPSTKNGLGIGFYVRLTSNKPTFYKDFISSRTISPKKNCAAILNLRILYRTRKFAFAVRTLYSGCRSGQDGHGLHLLFAHFAFRFG